MKYSAMPDLDFRLDRMFETGDLREFVALLEEVPAETPVAWYSHKDEIAHPGAWVRRGLYRLKHGSFVDPSDLSAYAAQYYEPFASGRHEAIQIGRTPQSFAAPEDAIAVSTVEELAAAIRDLSPEAAWEEEDPMPSDLKILQPDYAFEFHGALTRGWHAQVYAADVEEEGVSARLLVLR